jgi:hypothetical protein
LKPVSIFDISLVNTVSVVLISRILGIIANYNSYFAVVGEPSTALESNMRWYKALPWNLFNVFDGGYIFGGLLLGLIFSTALVFVKVSQNKSFLYIMDRLVISFSITIIYNLIILILLRDSSINSYLSKNMVAFEGMNIDTWGIQILLLSIFLVLTRITNSIKKLGLTTIVFELIFAGGIISTDIFSHNELNIGLNRIIAISFVVFAIIQYVQLHSKSSFSATAGLRERLEARTGQDISSNQIARDYSQSYRVMDQPNMNRLSQRDKFRSINKPMDRGANSV